MTPFWQISKQSSGLQGNAFASVIVYWCPGKTLPTNRSLLGFLLNQSTEVSIGMILGVWAHIFEDLARADSFRILVHAKSEKEPMIQSYSKEICPYRVRRK